MRYLERSVEDKKIVWFMDNNQYLLLEMPAYKVINKLSNGDDPKATAYWFSEFYQIPEDESKQFVNEIIQFLEQQFISSKSESETIEPFTIGNYPSAFYSRKHYEINRSIYSVEYETEHLEHLIHPKFAYLETIISNKCEHFFQVFKHKEKFVLTVNNTIIGQWSIAETHFFTGKFSMELLNRIYNQSESDWMGVFHASAVSYRNQCVMFLGESGSGKSTISAILMASGFDLLADDFVPVDAFSREVCFFPAAISVKKNAIEPLLMLYPQLTSVKEFYYPGIDKTVRYLPPFHTSENHPSSYPCKALVFVRYQKDSGLILEKIGQDIAFKHLVPDSWVSPLAENVSRFLDWFLELPSYQLTYSDNSKMVITIEKLFQDDL